MQVRPSLPFVRHEIFKGEVATSSCTEYEGTLKSGRSRTPVDRIVACLFLRSLGEWC